MVIKVPVVMPRRVLVATTPQWTGQVMSLIIIIIMSLMYLDDAD